MGHAARAVLCVGGIFCGWCAENCPRSTPAVSCFAQQGRASKFEGLGGHTEAEKIKQLTWLLLVTSAGTIITEGPPVGTSNTTIGFNQAAQTAPLRAASLAASYVNCTGSLHDAFGGHHTLQQLQLPQLLLLRTVPALHCVCPSNSQPAGLQPYQSCPCA